MLSAETAFDVWKGCVKVMSPNDCGSDELAAEEAFDPGRGLV